MSQNSTTARGRRRPDPYEMKTSRNGSVWEPADEREVRYWLDGYTYTAATAVLALAAGEVVETDWCRIRRRPPSAPIRPRRSRRVLEVCRG